MANGAAYLAVLALAFGVGGSLNSPLNPNTLADDIVGRVTDVGERYLDSYSLPGFKAPNSSYAAWKIYDGAAVSYANITRSGNASISSSYSYVHLMIPIDVKKVCFSYAYDCRMLTTGKVFTLAKSTCVDVGAKIKIRITYLRKPWPHCLGNVEDVSDVVISDDSSQSCCVVTLTDSVDDCAKQPPFSVDNCGRCYLDNDVFRFKFCAFFREVMAEFLGGSTKHVLGADPGLNLCVM